MTAQQEDEYRLKNSAAFLAHCRAEENDARVLLAQAAERTKRAKEKYEVIFVETEKRTIARIKAGILPPAEAGY